jgi:hypothetical protein
MAIEARFIFIALALFVMPWLGEATRAAENYTDPSRPIVVRPSAPAFAIELAGEPAQGRMWTLERFDKDLFELLDSQEDPGAAAHIWRLKARPRAFEDARLMSIVLTYMTLATHRPIESVTFTVIPDLRERY